MQLRQVGELALLRELQKRFNLPSQRERGVLVGIGDDAAVIAPGTENLIVTTDMMHEGVHFDLALCSPFQLGFKLVSVNVSDIMAMGGRPRHLFLNIAVRGDAEEAFFWDLYDGIAGAAALYGVALLGGDLSAARHDMVLSATVLGEGLRPVVRSGASVGEKIYSTAPTGDSACGLALLKRLSAESRRAVRAWRGGEQRLPALELAVDAGTLTLEGAYAEALIGRHLMPTARDPRPFLGAATAMLDVSDGLFIDLSRLLDAGGVGARVYLDRIPLSEGLKRAAGLLGLDPLALATSGGEDYELLFTAPADRAVGAVCIGEITAQERTIIDGQGRESAFSPGGYEHFAAS